MFTFKYLPQTRDRNLGVKKVEETGADFFIKIEEDVLNNLPMENVVKMTLRRGQSEFHDAHILHRSSENRSSRYLFITSVTQSHKGQACFVLLHSSSSRYNEISGSSGKRICLCFFLLFVRMVFCFTMLCPWVECNNIFFIQLRNLK